MKIRNWGKLFCVINQIQYWISCFSSWRLLQSEETSNIFTLQQRIRGVLLPKLHLITVFLMISLHSREHLVKNSKNFNIENKTSLNFIGLKKTLIIIISNETNNELKCECSQSCCLFLLILLYLISRLVFTLKSEFWWTFAAQTKKNEDKKFECSRTFKWKSKLSCNNINEKHFSQWFLIRIKLSGSSAFDSSYQLRSLEKSIKNNDKSKEENS